ncbi:ABC transporter permease [Arthrobacter sp. MYb23]|uniref:ABC transporter permease n=1 Tax=unclassified Arthrobacter TaxID=235627 RepID=UPI000CFC876C|nr:MULTISPECIES: ABC transporter permease [unclassified Arthrobacter]PRB41083.1 ABC transporter permease [Arthrobacter sp. MYb51]PRB94753.1 ABC transporter permease [Arthrobacter sp. MYb23]
MTAVLEPGILSRSRRRGRIPWIVVACSSVIFVVVLSAFLGSMLVPLNPDAQDTALGMSGPSGAHLLGTDQLGRDIFSRLIVGSRTAIVGPAIVALSSMIIGDLLGLFAGYRGGWVDSLIMRWVDLMWSIPALLLIIVVAGAFGGGYWLAIGLLIVLIVPLDVRVVRGATIEQMPRPYVEAARTLGVPGRRILLSHIWPNVAPVAVANTFLIFATCLVSLSGLSYLGLGVSPGTPDWGLMLAENLSLLFVSPLAALAPGLMIVLTAASTNILGDWVYERLSEKGVSR